MEVLKGETNKLRRSDDDDDDDDRARSLVLVLVGWRGCGMIPLSGDETVRRVFPVFFLLLGLGCVCVCVRPVGTKQEVWVGRPSSLNKYTFPRERQWTIKLLPLVLFPAPSPPSSFVLFSTSFFFFVFLSSGEDIHRTDRAHLLKKQPKRVLLAGSRVSVALPFSRLSLSFNGGRAIRVFRVNVCGPLRGRAERALFFWCFYTHTLMRASGLLGIEIR